MAEDRTPRVGDVAYLKSGSCRMTIEKVNDDGTIELIWQEYDQKGIMRTTVPLAVLDVKMSL